MIYVLPKWKYGSPRTNIPKCLHTFPNFTMTALISQIYSVRIQVRYQGRGPPPHARAKRARPRAPEFFMSFHFISFHFLSFHFNLNRVYHTYRTSDVWEDMGKYRNTTAWRNPSSLFWWSMAPYRDPFRLHSGTYFNSISGSIWAPFRNRFGLYYGIRLGLIWNQTRSDFRPDSNPLSWHVQAPSLAAN